MKVTFQSDRPHSNLYSLSDLIKEDGIYMSADEGESIESRIVNCCGLLMYLAEGDYPELLDKPYWKNRKFVRLENETINIEINSHDFD